MSSVATSYFDNVFSVVQFSFQKKTLVFDVSPEYLMENKPEVADVFKTQPCINLSLSGSEPVVYRASPPLHFCRGSVSPKAADRP